ncbi:MAG TPA: dTDP-4-dehydrorhamnose reductase [Solirubrobacteraceae bacterium]|nr:dTDP-4-dehydrorhamnose reductase [Solirubrobacteraceae bacterium]
MRLLVTGAAGMLGRDVAAAAEAAEHDVIALTRRDLDLTDPSLVRAAVQSARPDSVVNCAAWTDVDGAETAEEQATRVNGAGAGAVAAAAAGAGAHTVHVSSDYVFDGTASEPYIETSSPGPRSAYGRSKLAGERAVAEASPVAAIVRSSWLYGLHGRNFVATMLRLARERDAVSVVDDQIGCPTFTGHLASALVEVAERRLTGVLHVAGEGSCSWCELARATFEQAGADCRAEPVSSAEFPRPAPRPAWSVLGSTRPDAPRLPAWRDGLEAYLAAAAVTR